MRYWWVNQNQTYDHELRGGYLWSPKRNRNKALNPFYEFMREVSPGDLVFSFCATRIRAFGIATSHAYEAPKPAEFGNVGRNWNDIGWRVDLRYHELLTSFRPADWMPKLGPLLPKKYAPLRSNGHGLQSVYLTELPREFALAMADLIGSELSALARAESTEEVVLPAPRPELVLWEEHLHEVIRRNDTIPETQRQALVLARRGQGLFRELVQSIERRCRITQVDRPEHLRASHCKPGRDSSDAERLDPENGLLLTPSIDHLFDRGFISFEDTGRLLISPVAHTESLAKMGVPVAGEFDAGRFTRGQASYLEYHRDEVYLKAAISR